MSIPAATRSSARAAQAVPRALPAAHWTGAARPPAPGRADPPPRAWREAGDPMRRRQRDWGRRADPVARAAHWVGGPSTRPPPALRERIRQAMPWGEAPASNTANPGERRGRGRHPPPPGSTPRRAGLDPAGESLDRAGGAGSVRSRGVAPPPADRGRDTAAPPASDRLGGRTSPRACVPWNSWCAPLASLPRAFCVRCSRAGHSWCAPPACAREVRPAHS